MRYSIPYDYTDLGFRVLFSLIFLALGAEHLFSDALIRSMMPGWLGAQRTFSIGAGCLLLAGGSSILLGFKVRAGAAVLAVFLIVVTAIIHVPAVIGEPTVGVGQQRWLWDLYQRSNLMKNLCLLGGCIHLLNHRLGRFSIEGAGKHDG